MARAVHEFDNGVKVYDEHLLPIQRERYAKRNVHEAEEEDVFLKLVNAIPPSGCFLNIGTAIGYYPILAKSVRSDLLIHAVEPLARHRDYFLDNINLNGLAKDSFQVHEQGIAASFGEVEFLDKGYGSVIQREPGEVQPIQDTSLRGVARAILQKTGLRKGIQKTKIVTRTLDDLCAEISLQVDLCQMDVQGLEVEVLTGAATVLSSGQIKTFLIGTHGPDIHLECAAMLKENGYEVVHDEYDTTDQPDGILVATKS